MRAQLEIDDNQIISMAMETVKNAPPNIRDVKIKTVKSDSFGDHNHRVWIFSSVDGAIIGSLERYWSGLKMISSLLGGTPRTTFFTEDGRRTTNRGLKGLN